MRFEHILALSDKQALIRVEGLSEPVTLLHITDSHMNETDASEGAGILAESIRSYVFDALDTRTKFERLLHYANEVPSDCTILTGDIVNGATNRNLAFLAERLSTLRSPWLYTVGNHDWEYPGEPWGESTRIEQIGKFNALTGGSPSCQAQTIGGVLLLAVDNSTYQISEEQLAFLERELARGLPTLLFMHIPIYIPSLLKDVLREWGSPIVMAGEGWDPEQMKAWQVEPASPATMACYRMLMENPYENLMGLFCGHVHTARSDMFGRHSRQYVTQAGFAGGYRVIRLVPMS